MTVDLTFEILYQLTPFDQTLMPAFALEANLFFSSKGGKPLVIGSDDGLGSGIESGMSAPVDREDPAQLAKMDVSASVLIEATTTCKNNKLTQGLKARVTYALQTQVYMCDCPPYPPSLTPYIYICVHTCTQAHYFTQNVRLHRSHTNTLTKTLFLNRFLSGHLPVFRAPKRKRHTHHPDVSNVC
jgi:hypothetical protein